MVNLLSTLEVETESEVEALNPHARIIEAESRTCRPRWTRLPDWCWADGIDNAIHLSTCEGHIVKVQEAVSDAQ